MLVVSVRHDDLASRAHFLAVASKAMRHILINHAEGRQAEKRGGDARERRLTRTHSPRI